jgi:ubiquinone/menaquinone biosynthesis C-methylase UbiE
MTSRFLPLIYERLWRPVGVSLLTGAMGPRRNIEEQLTRELLALAPGDHVLDVACGPGNITRRLRALADPDSLIVGIDASATMLARAVKDTAAENVAYIRGDAQQLPFRDETFEAVCCYAALYLMDDPFAAIDEIVRVLAPGGRVAVLTSVHRGPGVLRPLNTLLTAPSGIRMFASDEVTGAFAAYGLADIRQRLARFGQFVGARKPAAGVHAG